MHRPIWRFVMSAMVCGLLLSSTTSWAQGSRPLIDQNTARRYGLNRAWYKQISLDRTRDRIASVTLDHGGLFVQTKQGLLVALDAESGETLWSRQIGSGEIQPALGEHEGKTYRESGVKCTEQRNPEASPRRWATTYLQHQEAGGRKQRHDSKVGTSHWVRPCLPREEKQRSGYQPVEQKPADQPRGGCVEVRQDR